VDAKVFLIVAQLGERVSSRKMSSRPTYPSGLMAIEIVDLVVGGKSK
jgi:hypothetical protein